MSKHLSPPRHFASSQYSLEQHTSNAAHRQMSQRHGAVSSSKVDMNTYNLNDLETIASEWTANVLPKTDFLEAGIYLGAKNSKELFVDTIKLTLPRRIGQGMGLELLELAGGREDGKGITIVSGIVEGGCADGSNVLPGDSIIEVAVVKQSQTFDNGMTETEETTAVVTECLDWDGTIDAIKSLPPPENDNETLQLTVKRLRRKPKVKLQLQYPPEMNEPDIKLELFAGENLRRAMLVRGVKLNDPLSKRFDSGGSGDCGAEGTCATCAVSIVRGDELLSPQGVQESQIFVKHPRWRMACKAIVGQGMREGDLVVRINPRQW
ncbi:hypothetical protein MPSEU_000688700 [Mayamaea pseudoterrestris]|nr:hypothetical protein MPSEU_000688700 [Mayamaea pseudoterrestris]